MKDLKKLKKNKNGTIRKTALPRLPRKKYCECGNEAFRKYNGEIGCERCIAIEKKWAYSDEQIRKERERRKTDFYETELSEY